MRFSIFRFIGKPKELVDRLDQLTRQNVIHLGRCELCGGLSKGDICRKCEPLFRRWTKKIALEMKATTKPFKPIIA
jgi:recombinational DNA repair protein RecR